MSEKSSAAHSRQRASIASTASSTDGTAEAAFSRSTGLPARLGKATAEIRSKVPEVVKEDWDELVRRLGTNDSELLRELVMVRLYGLEQVQRMHANRLLMVAGMGPVATLDEVAQ